MYGTYDFINANNNTVINGKENSINEMNTDQALPVSASTQVLFQSINPDPKLQTLCTVSIESRTQRKDD